MTKRQLLAAIVVALGALVSASGMRADAINGSATGLASPTQTITFGEIALPVNTMVTTQYSGLGVSFSPNGYYDPQIGYGLTNDIGNFTFTTQPAFVNPFTMLFSTPQTAVDFQMAGDGNPFLFQAYLGGSLVDSFTSTVGFPSPLLYYGFGNDDFNSIKITQAGAGSGPYWLIGNVQFGVPAVATAPEPSSILLLGIGIVGLGFNVRRRRTVNY